MHSSWTIKATAILKAFAKYETKGPVLQFPWDKLKMFHFYFDYFYCFLYSTQMY